MNQKSMVSNHLTLDKNENSNRKKILRHNKV
jgi:hypothetical protein